MVNMGIDRVFLGAMADSAQLGLYAAANLFVGAFFFIPTALIGTLAPKLIAQHGKSIGSFHSQAGKLFSNVGAVLLSIVIAISIFSGDIINLVFGEHYFGAGKVLAISCWSILFVFQVSLRGRLLIIEGRQKELSMLISLGTFTNVLLNYFLIPHYGAVGAAYAFSISWFASALVFPAIFINTRKYILMCFGVTPNL